MPVIPIVLTLGHRSIATEASNETLVDMLRRDQVRSRFPFLLQAYEARHRG